MLFAAVTMVALLTGCRPGLVGTPAPVEHGVPVAWKQTVNSTEIQVIPATLVLRNGQPVGRDSFLQRFRTDELRKDLADAIEGAPQDALVYAGFLDENCSPSTAVQVIVNDGTVSFVRQSSGHQGECYVHYASYAVVAIAPESLTTR